MLPKKRRINKDGFKEVLARSAFASSPLFTLRWSKVSNVRATTGTSVSHETPSTFAVVISKKVMALATNRNKIKRSCYHALRDLTPQIKDSYRIVFFAKKGVEKLSFKELSENVRLELSKNHLIR